MVLFSVYVTISHIVTPRKDFLPPEIAAIAKALRPVAKKEAKERAEEGRKLGGEIAGRGRKKEDSLVETFHQPKREKARDKVASYAGVSGRTLEKIEAVVEAAKEEPEKYEILAEKMDKTGKVDAAYKALQHEKMKETIKQGLPSVRDSGDSEGIKTSGEERGEGTASRGRQTIR